MKFVLQSLIVFFGTLMAAALVALGEPATAELALVAPPGGQRVVQNTAGWTQAVAWLGLR